MRNLITKKQILTLSGCFAAIWVKNITSHIRDNGHSSTVSTEAISTDGKRYRLKKVNGDIKELRINGVKVADEQIKDYRELIGKMEMAGRKDKKEIGKEQLINDIRQKQTAELAKTDWNKVVNEKMKEAMANIDLEKIKMETDKALQKIDWDKMKEDIRQVTKEALAELDMEKIKAETEGALQKINWDKMKDNIDQAMKETQESLKKINREQMKKQAELKQQEKMKAENQDRQENK
jgi:hypothetical protein